MSEKSLHKIRRNANKIGVQYFAESIIDEYLQ